MPDGGPASGKLSIVSTPLGNLDDVSPRARQAFERADLVACEDTRRTGRLLAHLGIKKKLISLHEHNERKRLPGLLERIEEGAHVALASDAGTPLLSDPGFVLTREAIARGIRVEPIAGPSAVLAALVVSGLPPLPFTFAGFAPPKSGKRRKFYARLAALDHTIVLFESPHRLLASLEDAEAELGDRPAAAARELTKMHEEVVRGRLSEIRAVFDARPAIKGELTLVISGPDGRGPESAAGGRIESP
jgi:16S rRNA (cytidine1402-2'-O)-methyltransferase